MSQKKEFRTDPEFLIGKRLRLPDFRRALDAAHQAGGWGPLETSATQGTDSFHFDGKLFAHYAGTVFGKQHRIRKVYFPAAYTGKVALAIKEAGFSVLASDLSEHWSARLRTQGLGGDRRSFEDFPDERFDAVVVFEPYCIPSPLEFLAVLESMARGIPYLDIRQFAISERWDVLGFFKPGKKEAAADEEYRAFRKALLEKRIVRFRQAAPGSERVEYGARTMEHFAIDNPSLVRFRSVTPEPVSEELARLDLLLIKNQQEWFSGDEISLGALASRLGAEAKEIAGALRRIRNVAVCWFISDDRTELAREFTIIG